MIVRFTTSDGKARSGYVVTASDDAFRVCTAPGTYFSIAKEDAEIV